MFGRNFEKELQNWKDSRIRKVLILRGARQVGKTSVVRKFGIENFGQLVEINLEQREQKQWFNGVKSLADFSLRTELYLKKRLNDGQTLVFIDEVQESPELLGLLRFFAEERPELHVIAAGSLLEAKMAGSWHVPVGRVEYRYMYPLTFFEFLSATGNAQWRQYLEQLEPGKSIIGEEELRKLFTEYMLVGGLPEAVATSAKGLGIGAVKEIQARLFAAYSDDIGHYASGADRKYLDLAMATAPKLAGGLFKYENMGGSGYRGREIREAVDTLENIMLLTQVQAINSTTLPVFPKAKRAKKMIWLDIGLVNYANGSHEIAFQGSFHGRLLEQVVGQTLVAEGIRNKTEMYYWARDRDMGSAEVDFVIREGSRLAAIEVKSGETREMKSLFSMMDDGRKHIVPIRTSWSGFGPEKYRYGKRTYEVLSVPFYLLERWKELV